MFINTFFFILHKVTLARKTTGFLSKNFRFLKLMMSSYPKMKMPVLPGSFLGIEVNRGTGRPRFVCMGECSYIVSGSL